MLAHHRAGNNSKKKIYSVLFAGLAACGVSVRSTVTALSTDDTDTAYHSTHFIHQQHKVWLSGWSSVTTPTVKKGCHPNHSYNFVNS